MYTVDTEDDSQGNVFIINFFDGANHTTFIGENLRYKAWSFLNRIAPSTVWAVNLGYDLINIFGMEWVSKLCTLQYVKAGLMRGIFREAKILFLDTVRHWPASVEDMGRIVGLPKLSMPHTGCDCDNCVIYCQRDSEITWIYVNEMLQRYEDLGLSTIRATLPSMAMQLFKQFYAKEFPEISSYIKREMRKGYYGGRVEIYRLGKILEKINHYDVNSLFPSVMRVNSFPDPSTLYSTKTPNLEKEGIFEGWIFLPQSYFPCLPVRDDEILFPYGTLFGSWCYPEVRQALADGGKIIGVKNAIEFDETENPFDSYIDFCYQKRLASTNEIDKSFYKLLMNSLYGKFGSHNQIVTISNDRESIIGGESKTSNIIWSAYTTCYARLRLLDYLRRTGTVFYTDTDSLFTSSVLDTSNRLGELKLEGQYDEAEFKGNKLYLLDDEARAKGVKREKAAEFFKTGRTNFQAPVRYREARARGLQANVWREVEKRNLKRYTKRKVLNDGLTESWEYSKYKEFKQREELL